jgi:transposase
VLSGYDDDLAADTTRQANRLRDALTSLHPPLERVLGPRLDQPAVRAVLVCYPTPSALRTAGKTRIHRLLKGRALRSADRLTGDVWTALQFQTVTVATEARLGQVIAELAAELDCLHTRRHRLAGDIEAVFRPHPLGSVLASLPGVGPRTGAKILAEIGDGHRSASRAQLAAYAGLAPVTRQPSSSIRGEIRSQRGNHRLKKAMFLAACCSLRSPESKAFYARKRTAGKRDNAAVICLARRRCDVILAMLKTGTHYDPNRTASPSQTHALAA